jgi:glycosyltransferase involved in cell wall biosynthesis
MRILHLGWGFTPWRSGGLIRYAEDVMALQASRGHDVHYLCAGRHYPRLRGPRVKRRRRDGVQVHEVVNGPILVDLGTRVPALDLREPWLEGVFRRLLAELQPAVVHVQELLGFPSSVLEIARSARVPVAMTLQDYFPLCPSVRLLDADGRLCDRRELVPACAAACAGAPADPGPVIARTLRYELTRAREAVPGLRRVGFGALRGLVDPVLEGAPPPPPAPPSVAEIQRRREVNLGRLNGIDALLAQSRRVEALYRRLGVDSPRLRTMHLTLAHLERLTPRPPRRPGPLTFATVDGLSAPSKGSELLLEAVRRVRAGGAAGRFRLLAHGFVDAEAARAARSLPEVELRGRFATGDVDSLLDDADVGVIPSVWEEAYGFVGLEFLAKGIPLLASARGGIVDYAREGETAWLNRSVTAEELAAQMRRLIDHPGEVDALAAKVRAAAGELIVPLGRHADALEAVYRDAAAAAS